MVTDDIYRRKPVGKSNAAISYAEKQLIQDCRRTRSGSCKCHTATLSKCFPTKSFKMPTNPLPSIEKGSW